MYALNENQLCSTIAYILDTLLTAIPPLADALAWACLIPIKNKIQNKCIINTYLFIHKNIEIHICIYTPKDKHQTFLYLPMIIQLGRPT